MLYVFICDKFDEMRENEEAAVKEVEVEQQQTTEQSSDKPVFIKYVLIAELAIFLYNYKVKRSNCLTLGGLLYVTSQMLNIWWTLEFPDHMTSKT